LPELGIIIFCYRKNCMGYKKMKQNLEFANLALANSMRPLHNSKPNPLKLRAVFDLF
jgi:hypothetical protein